MLYYIFVIHCLIQCIICPVTEISSCNDTLFGYKDKTYVGWGDDYLIGPMSKGETYCL